MVGVGVCVGCGGGGGGGAGGGGVTYSCVKAVTRMYYLDFLKEETYNW